jgi:hypothetical protein
MSKSSEDTFCSEQKLIFGDYTRRWACRARRYQEVRVLYEMVLDGWCRHSTERIRDHIIDTQRSSVGTHHSSVTLRDHQ